MVLGFMVVFCSRVQTGWSSHAQGYAGSRALDYFGVSRCPQSAARVSLGGVNHST